ncbi:MAG: hypothetical protein OSB09_03710 [Planctomycetota bacterium]|nr:hypothetical protein [Planctomycetota bacterium]
MIQRYSSIASWTLLLVLLCTVSISAALASGEELRGNWLQFHLLVATPLAALLVIRCWWPRPETTIGGQLAWWLMAIAMGLVLIPMLGWTSSENSLVWVEGHGWLSLLAVVILGCTVKIKPN